MNEPKISVIIPVYNRASIIGDTLDSLMLQTYENWECIVVDDGSKDGTLDVVKKYVLKDSRYKIVSRPPNKTKGASSCRNFGLGISNGTYVNWLDSDDLISKNHLETHIKVLINNPSIGASVTQAETFKVGETRNGKWSKIKPKNDTLTEMILGQISWQTATVVWRRSVLDRKPFPEKLSSSQEWTFHVIKLIRGVKFKIMEVPTVYVRRHETRIGKDFSSQKFYSFFFSRYYIYQEIKNNNKLTNRIEKALLHRMFQSTKNAIRFKYDLVLLKQILALISLIRVSNFKIELIKVLFFSIPIYRVFRKGETFFSDLSPRLQ